ncbi:MAG: hypothetical protein HS108_07345 [Planctomycetes bacterium]|nr:hypothetical protein [Planctomycetota bacterium]MCL4729259.1 hypothetical protein [Planctomycetota bacterium]
MNLHNAAARLLVVLLALGLAASWSRPATAADDFGVPTDKKLAKALSDLAETCYQCGEKAKEKGLYTNARSFFDHALRYDPDHAKTRKVMGFKKKGKNWVMEDDLIPLKDIVNEKKREEIEQKLTAETLDLRTKAAESLWKFVTDTALEPQTRMLALFHVLRLCPEHREAQKAARANPDRRLFKHALDDEHDTLRDKRINEIAAPEKFNELTPYEKTLGYPMAKRRSAWYVFHCDMGEVSESWVEPLTRFAEASRNHQLELMGLTSPPAPKADEHRLHYTAIGTRERFAAFIDKCSGLTDPSERSEIAKVGGGAQVFNPYGSVWLYPNTENDYGLRDAIAHDVSLKDVLRCTDMGGYWLAHGFGYLNSTHMNGSCASTFYGTRASGVINTGGKESLPGLGTCAAGWRLEVLLRLVGGTAIKPGELARLRVNDFTEDHMAAAFCIADYLSSQHKEKLKAFFEGALAERSKRRKDKQAPETGTELVNRLLNELGMDEGAFMVAFKAWAVVNYVKLP